MPTVEEKQKKEDVASQSGCCGGVSQAAEQKESVKGESCGTTSSALDVKVEKKEGEQVRSCCG